MSTILFIGFFVLLARYVDHRRLRDYGFHFSRSWGINALLGFLLMPVLTVIWVGVSIALGWATLEPGSITNPSEIVIWFLFSLIVVILPGAVAESIVYAGIVAQNTAEGLRARGMTQVQAITGAFLVPTLLFSGLHFVYGNPTAFGDIPALGAFIIWVTCGGLMVASYLVTENLGFAIGVNAGLNIGGWLFNPGIDMLGIPSPFLITHTPPALVELIGGAIAPAYALGYGVLILWMFRREQDFTIVSPTTHG